MKKFLLPCLLALGISANAQTYFSDDFEDEDVSDWTTIDSDGDGKNWADMFFVPDSAGNPTTPVSLISRSWQVNALTPDNWIISPAIDLSSATGSLSLNWKVKCANASWDNEHYTVYVGTASDIASLEASTVQFSETYDDPANAGTQYSRTLDVSSLAGQTIYVAFRHHDVTDMDYISIDDVVVKAPETTAPSCTTLTTPANAATGVATSGTVLTWAASTGADSYDIYLDTNTTPTTLVGNSSSTSYTLTTSLASETNYYWSVVPKNSIGSATGCSVFSFTTKVATPPGCASNFSPADGASVNIGTVPLSWSAPTTGGAATSYDVYWGTSSTTLTKLGNTTNTAVNITNVTAGTFYWQIVPVNADGTATGCAINSLIAIDTFAPYCSGNLIYSSGREPITSVKLNDLTNTSSAATTSPAHENFIDKVATVEQGKAYDITFEGYTGGNYSNKFIAFIDWNQDGDFLDADETYFGTTDTALTLTNSTGADGKTVTGSIAVPAGATLGNTRMRIKKNYGSATSFYLSPCYSSGATATATTGTAGYGQAEDYTINVISPTMAVSDVNKDNISVYPNPFADVLKISDIKGVKSISVNDISGREVKSLAPSAELNLSNLNAGLYIVNLKMEDGSVKSFKAIKK